MNPRYTETRERLQTIDCAMPQEGSQSSREGDVSHGQPLWIPDDFDEPESWTLASFSDLVPCELA